MKKKNILIVSIISILILLLGYSFNVNGKNLEWPSLLSDIRHRFPDVAQLTIDELADWMKNGKGREQPLLIDVRAREEFEMSNLNGSIYVNPSEDWVQKLKDVPKNKPIIVYCSVGERSSIFAQELIKEGFQNVYNLEGGIFMWANSKRPVYKDDKETKEVHPFNTYWGRLLNKDRH